MVVKRAVIMVFENGTREFAGGNGTKGEGDLGDDAASVRGRASGAVLKQGWRGRTVLERPAAKQQLGQPGVAGQSGRSGRPGTWKGAQRATPLF